MLALARRLQSRGHELTFFHLPDLQQRIEAAGIRYVPVGENDMPAGTLIRELEDLAGLDGAAAFERVIGSVVRETRLVLRDAPALLKEQQLDLLLIDECCDAAATVARTRGIPFISLALALTRYEEAGIPYWACPLPWSQDPAIVAQYKLWSDAVSAASASLREVVNTERAKFAIAPVKHISETHSDLATITQQPRAFDYPRKELPDTFHYTGPFFDPDGRVDTPFPWEQLDGRPLIYASLGTLQNRLPSVFRAIADACEGLEAQLLIALGGGLQPEELGPLPGNPLVRSYAPQEKILQHASLMITHAGMNSSLECLSCGVPMVAIPIAHDQPPIAQRIAWTGAGVITALETLSAEAMRTAILDVLTQPGYRAAARRLQQEIRSANGLAVAADIVEEVLRTGRPVRNERRGSKRTGTTHPRPT
jgi:MGT family glycosyltransferase